METPAEYINYSAIICVTPDMGVDPADIYEWTVELDISMN